MQAIKFPVPNRSEYIPSPYEPDADGVLDIGSVSYTHLTLPTKLEV